MRNKTKQGPYEDIVNLPRPVSIKRSQMPRKDRAAQFTPFAAVVGHEAAVKETARLVDVKKDLDDMQKTLIDQNLSDILSGPSDQLVKVIYFVKDIHKEGGEYEASIGHLTKYDAFERLILLDNGLTIFIDDVYSINIWVPDTAREG